MVLPIRGHLDSIGRMMVGDYYIGRGCRQRGLSQSLFCNDFKVSVFGRDTAIEKFSMKLLTDTSLRDRLWTLSGVRLVCHCKLAQRCHGDIIIREFRAMFPDAFDRDDSECAPPSSAVLNYMSRLREEPASGSESSADEGAPPKGSGWTESTMHCWCRLHLTRTLATARHWHLRGAGRCGDSPSWRRSIANKFIAYSNIHGTTELLMQLALGRVESSPFDPDSIRQLKSETLEILAEHGLKLERSSDDRKDVPIDYRYMDLLLRASEDPEVGIGDFASGVRVGPGARLPRLPALYARKKRWRLPKQMDPLDYLEDQSANDAVWRLNYSSLEEHSDSVLEVLVDQANRGQVLRLSEEEARRRFPNLTVASLGAQKKEKPGGVISARVLFDAKERETPMVLLSTTGPEYVTKKEHRSRQI